MKIKVRYLAPKYVKGEHEFRRFEDFFNWLVKIRGLPRGGVGKILYGIAKDGHFSAWTACYCIEIESDFHDYFLARRVAQRVGLLRPAMSGDRISPDRAKALAFAKALDEEALKHKKDNLRKRET